MKLLLIATVVSLFEAHHRGLVRDLGQDDNIKEQREGQRGNNELNILNFF